MPDTLSLRTSDISTQLRRLKTKQFLARFTGFFTRLFEAYFLMFVVSFFLGFMQMFPFDEFGNGFPKYISYFMYFVLGIVVLIVSNGRVKSILGGRSTELVKNKLLVNSLTLVFAAIIATAGWFMGTRFLGNEFSTNFMLRWVAGFLSVFVLLIPYYLLKRVEKRFNSEYKAMLIPEFILQAKTNLKWDSEKYLRKDDFIASGLFPARNIYSYIGSDLFSGDEFNFRGSRLTVLQKEMRTSSGKSEVKISELFNGYLFIADFNKSFKGLTFLYPDHMRDAMGEIYGELANEWIKKGGFKLTKLEDRDFEKRYVVYSTDEVEARYLLSPKLIEAINSFSENYYQDISIAFNSNQIFVAVATKSDIIRPNLYGRIDDAKYLDKQFQQLEALLSIPKEFDLKTKIWG